MSQLRAFFEYVEERQNQVVDENRAVLPAQRQPDPLGTYGKLGTYDNASPPPVSDANERQPDPLGTYGKLGTYDNASPPPVSVANERQPNPLDNYVDSSPSPPPQQNQGVAPAKPKWRLNKEELKRLQGLTAKKHNDALKSDPTVAALLERKGTASKQLFTLLKKPGATREEIAGVSAELEQINTEMAAAQRALNNRGVSAKRIGAEYKDEDKKVGWRATEKNKLDPESDKIVTKHYTEDERKQSQLNVDEQGKVRDSDGDVMDGTVDYVMDPDEKKLHQFKMGSKKVQAEHVKPETGEKEVFEQDQRTHHSSILSGAEVAGAGGVKFSGGKIESISNASGHYKPTATQLIQTVEALLQQGALLDKTYMMLDKDTGKGAPLAGKAKDVYDKVRPIQKKLEEQATQSRGLQDQIDQMVKSLEALVGKTAELEPGEVDADGKAKGGQALEVQKQTEKLQELVGKKKNLDHLMQSGLDAVSQAKAVLTKLGAAPANKFTDAQVEHLQVKQEMTGAQVHEAKVSAEKRSVEDFLTSGGGNEKQAESKKDMLEELKAKTAKRRDQLDAMAEVRSKKAGNYFKQVESKTLPKLKEQLAKVSGSDGPVAQKAAANLQKLITNYEAMLKAKSGPSDDDVDKALTALQALDEKLREAEAAHKAAKGGGGAAVLSEMKMGELLVEVYM